MHGTPGLRALSSWSLLLLVLGAARASAQVPDAGLPRPVPLVRLGIAHVFCHPQDPQQVVLTADGGVLVTAADDGVRTWSVATGAQLSLQAQKDTARVAPDGRAFVTGDEHGARLIEVSSGAVRFSWPGTGWLTHTAWSPDSAFLLLERSREDAPGAQLYRLLNATTGQEVAQWTGCESYTLAVSRGGALVASGCEDGTAHVWDVAARKDVLTQKASAEGKVRQVVLSGDAGLLATTGVDASVRVYEVKANRQRWLHQGKDTHAGAFVAFEPGGRALLAGAIDDQLTRHALDTGAVLAQVPRSFVDSPVWLADGRTFFAAQGPLVLRFDSQTLVPVEQAAGHTDTIYGLVVAKDGRTVVSVSGDGDARVWDVATGAVRQRFTWGPEAYHLALSADGALLAHAEGPALALVDVASGKELRRFDAHAEWTGDLAFAPDGRTLVSSGRDGALRVWDVASGKRLKQLADPKHLLAGLAARGLARSPSGRWVVVGSGLNSPTLFDATGAAPPRVLWKPARGNDPEWPTDGLVAFDFSADEKWVAVGGGDSSSGNLTVRETATGSVRTRFHELKAPVKGVAFLRGGAVLVSGSGDGALRLWDVVRGEPLDVLVEPGAPGVGVLARQPGGDRFATAHADFSITVWAPPSP